MANRPESWPQAVDELLPNTLFKLAAQYPDLTYSEYPRTSNAADGYRKITFKEVANAVHAMAWWIDQNVGKPPKDDGSETLVYMGPNDLRYGILVLGSVMVGYKVSKTDMLSTFNFSRSRADALPNPTVRRRIYHRTRLPRKRFGHVGTVRSIPGRL